MENQDDIHGICRCCLALGNHRHIMREYTYNGAREVYMEMFLDCMNLFLINDPRLPPLICSDCVRRLREVCTFRTLVSNTEQQLIEEFNNGSFNAIASSLNKKENCTNDKTEDIDNNHLDLLQDKKELKVEWSDDSNPPCSDIDTYFTDTEIKKENTKKVKLINKKNKKKKLKTYDSESDTPIAEIKINKKQKNDESRNKKDSFIDNRKLRSNITLILQHSTIIPFKNNFKTKYNCFYCNQNYVSFKELKEHTEKKHNNPSEGIIDDCVKQFQDLIVSADISCIKCKICDAEFKSIDNLIEHLCKTHEKVFQDTVRKPSHGILGYDLSSDTLKCHLCSKEFAFFKNLTVHMNEHYGLFVCYICGKKFLSEHRMKCHVVSHHEKDKTNTKCKHCGLVLKSEASMTYHVRKEHVKPVIKCLECPMTFPFSHYIARMNHMEIMHGIMKPKFKCDICQKEYSNSGSLGAHKRYTHKRSKEIRCELCGYITVHNTVMKRHMDVHNGVKNYECEFCKKTFAKPYTLKLHVRVHLNDKRHVCSLCDAAFIQKNSLRNHVKARHPDSGIDISKL